jgi:superfamily II DNA or RNA helicase
VVAVGDLDSLIRRLDPDEYRRGKQFERIVEWFLAHAPEYETQLRKVWLWDDWPDRPSQDLGIDLVAEARGGDLWAIQAKAYGPDSSVTKRDMDSFLSASGSRRFSYRLLVATTDRVAVNARKTMEQQAIPVGTLLRSDLAASGLNWPVSPSHLVAPRPPRKRLRPDQREAVRDVLAGFKRSERGQMIRACGTGKTLAALGVHEQLGAKRTLVLVPSLSLLSQTLREWTANAKEEFEYLAVCSDETVADPDAPVAFTHDLGVPVTTDATKVAEFLGRRGQRVIFSTYQSSPQIAVAYRKHHKPPALDLAICDEAHRCAGPVNSDFATILDPNKIRAKRRLFMTATPRYFTGRIIRQAKEADFEIASMDNEGTFGPVFHRLTFAQAIDQELLSDYRVVIVGVDDATYKEWAEDGTYVTRDGAKITDARTLAGEIGLAKAMRRYDLRRVITFHSRVDTARHFSNELPDVIAWMPSNQRPTGRIQADYVSGQMPTGERRRRLSRLANPQARERSLLSNARCLAEGVDVPTLDGVAFVDPRRSEIDIVQAVGRAIRLAPDKELGTIILPVFIDSEGDADEVLDQSVFKPIWDVLKALRSHDEELAEQLDTLRTARGRTRTSGRLPSKIVIDLPAHVGVEFADQFEARLVDATTTSWEFWFGLLQRFVELMGHARVPSDYNDGDYRLGRWVVKQRVDYWNERLAADRAMRLDAFVGWTWDARADSWEKGFDLLSHFVDREGHARVPDDWVVDRFQLGSWVGVQRRAHLSGTLDPERTRRLSELSGWSWDLLSDQWDEAYSSLQRFSAREGHTRVPQGWREGDLRLGSWVAVQRRRYDKDSLDPERCIRLESLPGWSWHPWADRWDERHALLKRFVKGEGHARVPQGFMVGHVKLGGWVIEQRTNYSKGSLDPERVQTLELLPGWSWEPFSDQWEEYCSALEGFVSREGHARVPRGWREGDLRLGSWVGRQRSAYAKGTMSPDKARRLGSLPNWSWDPFTEQWEQGYGVLQTFVSREGHARVPHHWVEDQFRLGSWVTKQRQTHAKGSLDTNRCCRVEALPGWSWDPLSDQWEQYFITLERFVAREGHARVTQSWSEDGLKLGSWSATQRMSYAKGSLDPAKAERLQGLPGWSWDPLSDQWEQYFITLERFVAREGHARVTQSWSEDGLKLGSWMTTQRMSYAKGSLDPAKAERLRALPGWSWDPRTQRWEAGYETLVDFAARHGHANVPQKWIEGHFNLGHWVAVQRRFHFAGSLDRDRARRLEAVPGWSWDPLSDQWDQHFAALERFAEREGHALVPAKHIEGGFKVGSWVRNQRTAYEKGVLDSQRVKRLAGTQGWTWRQRAARSQ